jgi:hypothetical protein
MRGTGVASTVNRRDFILTAVSIAGGLMIGIGAAPRSARAAAISEQPWNDSEYAPHEIDAWIAIDPDDSVLIRYQRSEMGQGSMTALPMMITEELQCDWSKVRIEYASSNRSVREKRVYGNMYSHGSMSVRESQKMVQQVGASALARSGVRMRGGAERGDSRTFGPHAALRGTCRRGRQGQARQRARNQDTRSIHFSSPPNSARRPGT